jgi:hypothetical protein
VADPAASVQLGRGFYAVENDSWRWTARSFSVTVRPPKKAAANGARLVFKFAIPEAVMNRVKAMKLTAKVNGTELPAEEYTNAGDHTYSRDLPASLMRTEAVTVDFALDKFLPPSPADDRELGVVASLIGLEAK